MIWLTADLPGSGGDYKVCPEDFFVEEIPLYPCSGQGEHLYLQVEKSGLTTLEMLRRIAGALKIPEREIGYAGLKDARAVTRQWISLPAACERNLARFDALPLTILESNRHSNRLRLGHLAGNRFRIRLRETRTDARPRAAAILAELTRLGVPNLFGEQRYGLLGNSHRLGQLLLQGNFRDFCLEMIGDPQRIENPAWRQAAELFRAGDLPGALHALPPRMSDERRLLERLVRDGNHRQAVLALPKRLLRLYLSALQSWLFDRLLSQRMPQLGDLQAGDLAYKHDNGACFLVEDGPREQPRADRFEISPSAPLFGSKVPLAQGQPGAAEQAILAGLNLTPLNWKLGGGLTMPGERRPLRVPLVAADCRALGNDLELEFCLPRGSYATSVLQEVIKTGPPQPPPPLRKA